MIACNRVRVPGFSVIAYGCLHMAVAMRVPARRAATI